MLIDDGELWAYFTVDDAVDGSYAWSYFNDYDHKMRGTITAATYASSSLLGYSYNNISSSSTRSTVRSLASSMISMVCLYLDDDLDVIGVTAEDLGFDNF